MMSFAARLDETHGFGLRWRSWDSSFGGRWDSQSWPICYGAENWGAVELDSL
jgi:hypothetical protein